jgi:hypothetical protein
MDDVACPKKIFAYMSEKTFLSIIKTKLLKKVNKLSVPVLSIV